MIVLSPDTLSFVWSTGDTTATVDSLIAGTYDVTATDANGCEFILQDLLIENNCDTCITPEILASQTTSATCDEDNGSINIEMVGGNTNYDFVWENNVSDTSFANNLAAGTYGVTISEIGNATCVLDTLFTIEVIAPTIVQVLSITPDSCDLGIGMIVLSPDTLDFVWSTGDTTAIADSLIAGTYDVTATDANGCEFILQDLLIENNCDTFQCELPQVAAIISNENCENGQGSIEIGIIGVVENYNFVWTPNVSDTTFANNLSAGTYQVSIQHIQDATCLLDTFFTIGNDIVEPVATVISNQPASCMGSNGEVIFQPINLIYDWGNGVFGFSNNNLSEGSYDVTVSDSTGCSTIITVEVGSENPLVAVGDVTQAGCDGGTTGTAGIEVNNGVGDFDFIWNDGNTDSLRADLAIGNYDVTVTDNGTGCTAETSFTIIQVTPGEATLMFQDTIVSTTCVGSDDGEVQFFANYSPFFHQPATMILTNSSTGMIETNGELAAGNYCISIEDAYGCFITEKCFEVIEPAPILILPNVVGESCTANGSINLDNVTGGTPDYIFDWAHIDGTDDPQNLDDLPAGPYEVIVTDATGCTEELIISVPDDCDCVDPQIALIEVDEENCSMANGAIEITMQGAITNYNFSWSIAGVGNTNQATGLIAGDYTVTISDASNANCFIVHTTTVQPIDGLVVDIITSPADCNEVNGQVTLEPVSYTYDWGNGVFGNTRNDLAVGTYTVTATTDGINCATEYEVIITGETDCVTPDTLYFTTFVNIPIDTICIDLSELPGTFGAMLPCNDPTNGTVMINSLDSCLAYIPDTDYLGQDTACVVACDQNGICDTTIIIINVIPDCDDFITIDSINIDTDDCDSLFNICLDIPFANISNYNIRNNGADFNGTLDSCENAGTQIQLGVGTHQLIFTDNTTGCQDTVLAWITCSTPPCVSNSIITEDSITLYTNDCNEPADYCIDVSLDDVLNYTIMSNGELYNNFFGGCDFDSIVSYSLFLLPGQGNFGPYKLNSWMLNGEVHNATFMTITELVDLMNVWDPVSEWVFNSNTFMITGGNTQNTFGQMLIEQINTGATAIIEVNANLEPKATEIYLDPGVNEVILTHNVTGCSDTVTVTVTCASPDILIDTILVNTIDTMCIPTDELIGTIVSYENDCEDSSGEFVIFSQVDGEWCVQYEGVEVGVDSACVVICDDLGICDTTYLYVTVIEPTVLDSLPIAVADVDTLRINTSTIVEAMFNDSINGVFDTIYILEQPTFGTAIMDGDGTITYTPNEDYCDTAIPDEMTYVLCNTFGCDTTTVSFYVTCSDLIIYTGFSPNGDGVNDLFYIEGVESFPNNELNIFNRWGNEVYFAQGYLNTWDGSWNGKILPDGTYFYVFQYENESGETIEESGYIQINR